MKHRNGHKEEAAESQNFFQRLGYSGRDWAALLIISIIVAICGVLGVSYVMGEGWSSFSVPVTFSLFAAATVVVAIVLMVLDAGIFRLSSRGRISTETLSNEMHSEKQPEEGEQQETELSEEDAELSEEDAGISEEEKVAKELVKAPEENTHSEGTTDEENAHSEGTTDEENAHSKGTTDEENTHSEGTPDEENVPKASRRSRVLNAITKITPSYTVKSIVIFSLIMAAFWLPWLIANFPGGTYWDTYYQIYQCYPENHPIAIIPYAEVYDNTLTDAWLVDHHPVLDTLIYGAFGMASDALTGNWMAGVFIFVCLQGAATIVAFTTAIAYLRKRNCPIVLCFAAYAFFCLMPFISTWALCMVKDSLFSLFYIPYFIMLFEAIRTRGAYFARKRTIILFIVIGLLLCLTKKTGMYVVVPTALIAAFVYRPRKAAEKSRKPIIAFLTQGITCVIVMVVLLPYVVFPLLNIAPGGSQEVLGTLFQQTARYVVDYPDEVTDEEREAIDAVLEYDNLTDQYRYNFQDSVKYRYNLDATTEDLINYLEVWVAQGMRHPESYLAALFSIAGYYVAPTGIINIRMVTVDTHMGDDQRYMLYNPDELDGMRNGMSDAYKAIAYTPGLDVPLLMVTYAFWLPAILIFVMLRRRLRCGVLFIPILIMLAFCVIAPVNDARYCIPMFYEAPLVLCMIASFIREGLYKKKPRVVDKSDEGNDGKSDGESAPENIAENTAEDTAEGIEQNTTENNSKNAAQGAYDKLDPQTANQ